MQNKNLKKSLKEIFIGRSGIFIRGKGFHLAIFYKGEMEILLHGNSIFFYPQGIPSSEIYESPFIEELIMKIFEALEIKNDM